MRNFNLIYQEEEAPPESSGGGGEEAPKESSLLDGAAPELSEGEFFLSDGIKGAGDMPEWYDSKRFKSVSEQAKSYRELEKKFGSFTGAPKDGYQLPEGVESDDELAKAYIEFATESNMNQEGFNKGFELLAAQMGVNEQVTVEGELAKLGDNAQQRIKTVEGYLKNNMGEKYSEIMPLVTTADNVQIVEMIMRATAPVKLPIDGGEAPTGITWDAIQAEMFKTDNNGNLLRSTSMDHEKKIQRMLKEYGGDKPNVEVFG